MTNNLKEIYHDCKTEKQRGEKTAGCVRTMSTPKNVRIHSDRKIHEKDSDHSIYEEFLKINPMFSLVGFYLHSIHRVGRSM